MSTENAYVKIKEIMANDPNLSVSAALEKAHISASAYYYHMRKATNPRTKKRAVKPTVLNTPVIHATPIRAGLPTKSNAAVIIGTPEQIKQIIAGIL